MMMAQEESGDDQRSGSGCQARTGKKQGLWRHQQHAQSLVDFLKTYLWLVEGNVVNYLLEEQWARVPSDWTSPLLELSVDEAAKLPFSGLSKPSWPDSLNHFLRTSKELSLARQPPTGHPRSSSSSTPVLDNALRQGMRTKKQHEIEVLGRFISELVPSTPLEDGQAPPLVIEVGSGHGYLSNTLSSRFALNVVGVDGCEAYTSSAAKRSEALHSTKKRRHLTRTPAEDSSEAKTPPPARQPTFLSSFIPPDTTPEQFQEMLGLGVVGGSITLVGLHTCGDLAPTTLRLFANCASVSGLVSIGCCYNKLTEQRDSPDAKVIGFPMSQYVQSLDLHLGAVAKMTACQAIQRWHQASESEDEKERQSNEVMFRKHAYRAVLEVLIWTRFGVRGRELGGVGKVRKSKSSSFASYARAAVKALKIDPQLIERDTLFLSDESLEAFFQSHSALIRTIPVYWSLRVCLAAPIESLILLDRLLFLEEKGLTPVLLPMFDPVISPRNLAICCLRRTESGSEASTEVLATAIANTFGGCFWLDLKHLAV